ncbi:MAG TPA: glycosyltransferase family 2 protein [Acidimicrobiales bacterium]|nr:glycosyltransferase family 2 protein [Acidimicrobiales bacterium]
MTYLLPIKSTCPPGRELSDYLRRLSRAMPVLVVDGSDRAVFAQAQREWGAFVGHVRPDPALACRNGKVHGVLTGLARATTPIVVIADDDVRYGDDELEACLAAIAGADAVMPQNYFDPLPWHARWDTARTLINRVTGGDFAGTVVVRRDALPGGYDGDVLFENLELMRTVCRNGGRVVLRDDLPVRRLPPTTRQFLAQRPRQAYDEFARPLRLAVQLAVLPLGAALASTRGRRGLAFLAVLTVAVAEAGRRRHGGRRMFPRTAPLFAPLWVGERAITSWCALALFARGGVRYGGSRIRRAASTSARAARAAQGGRMGAHPDRVAAQLAS